MRHPHELLNKNSRTDVPNISVVIAGFDKPGSLEQVLSTAKKWAYNKNHEYLVVIDQSEKLVDPRFPTRKLAGHFDIKEGFLQDEKNIWKIKEGIEREMVTIKDCMNYFFDGEWIDLFEYIRGEKSVDGFRLHLDAVNKRPGRGNFYHSYNLGGWLAKNEYIMQMVNDDMMFTPNWDLELWQAYSQCEQKMTTAIPVQYEGFWDNEKENTMDILNGPGAEPWYKCQNYMYERDFLDFIEKVKVKGKYLLESHHERHYGYMGFLLMRKENFWRMSGYDLVNYPKESQDIRLDTRFGQAGINKCVVLDCICFHERIYYIEDEHRKFWVG